MASCAPTGAIGDLGIILNSANFRPGYPVPWSNRADTLRQDHDRTNADLPDMPNADQVDGIAGGSADRSYPQAPRRTAGPEGGRSRWSGSGHSTRIAGFFARLRSFAYNILRFNQSDTIAQDRYAAALGGLEALSDMNCVEQPWCPW
jgi:hypothetical protein